MRAVGEFCALLWGPSEKSRQQSPRANGLQHNNLISPVIATRAQVQEVILPPEVAQAQGLPPGIVLRRTTIDEIRAAPPQSGPAGQVGPGSPSPQI